MKLAIVGSTRLVNHPDVFRVIRQALFKHRPTEVHIAKEDGVSFTAKKCATEFGLDLREFNNEVPRWHGEGLVGFRERNEQIAQLCDCLIIVMEPKYPGQSYGPAWTRDRVVALGKPVEEYTIGVA